MLSLALVHVGYSQSLTVDYIMRDPKWMGTSPSNAFWSHDSKIVYFNWNPQKNISDSLYAFAIHATAPEKANSNIIEKNNALSNAVYNTAGTQLVYGFRGDIYWTDIKTNKTTRVTQTEGYRDWETDRKSTRLNSSH